MGKSLMQAHSVAHFMGACHIGAEAASSREKRIVIESNKSGYSAATPPRSPEKDLGFMRMGSFNSRVKRTAAALTNPFSVQKLKPWGSADSVADGLAPSMPPPKSAVKKKKSKKVVDFPSSSSTDSLKSKLSQTPREESDSDSVYGFPS